MLIHHLKQDPFTDLRLDSISFEEHSCKLLTGQIVQDVRQDNCFDFLRYLFAVAKAEAELKNISRCLRATAC